MSGILERIYGILSGKGSFIANSVAASALVGIIAAVLGGLAPAAAASAASLAFCLSLPSTLRARKVSALEREAIPFLLKTAKLPRGTPARRILELPAAGGSRLLPDLLSEARNAYLKGSGRKSLERSLDDAFAPYTARSRKLTRFVETLKIGIANNFDASELLLKTAKDLQDVETLEEKRKAAAALQKYTILSASGLFVPFILGAAYSIVGLFSKMGTGLSGFGLAFSANPAALQASILAYCVILPMMSALFVSFALDGKGERLPVYLLALPAAAIVSFNAARMLLPL